MHGKRTHEMYQYIVLSRYAWYSIIEPMKFTNILYFHAMHGNRTHEMYQYIVLSRYAW